MSNTNKQTNQSVSDKNKSNLIRFLVFLFVVIIAVFWVTNLRSSWQTRGENDLSLESVKLKLENDLEKLELKVKGLEEGQLEIKEMISQEKSIQDSKDLLKNISEELDKKNQKDQLEEIDEIDEVIEIDNPEESNNDSEKIVWQQNNCPQWLNCMPMIDSEPRACQIPVGCEGYTQIAY